MMLKSKSMKVLRQDSFLVAGGENYLEDLYETYLNNPQTISAEWRSYFDQLVQSVVRPLPDVSHQAIYEQFLQLARQSRKHATKISAGSFQEQQERLIEFISAYPRLGHLQATICPFGFL